MSRRNPKILLPSHGIYVHWGFRTPVATLAWDLTVHVDPGTSVGEYLALFNGSIDGSLFYLGLQTDIFHPDRGTSIGKGLIFSTWWSFDGSDTRLAEGGFRQLGTHEGFFVGIRKPYLWTAGDYRVTLSCSEAVEVGDRSLDWFDLNGQALSPQGSRLSRPEPLGPSEWIGGIRFPRRNRERAATVDPGGLLFAEVYGGALTWEDVARWDVDVMAYGDDARCPSGPTEYPSYLHDQVMANADVHYDPARQRVALRLGAGAVKQHPPASWPRARTG